MSATLAETKSGASDQAAAHQAAGSSFYAGMRILPKAQREAMYAVYAFCRAVDDVADEGGTQAERSAGLARWRIDIAALYAGETTRSTARLAEPIARFGLDIADFMAIIDGMEMDAQADIRAPSAAMLDLYCDRVASAVGRLSVRIFGIDAAPGRELAHHLGRALQKTNILRDLDEDASMGRLYLPREALTAAGITTSDPQRVMVHPALGLACAPLLAEAAAHFDQARAIMARQPRRTTRAPRLMAAVYRAVLGQLEARGFEAPRLPVHVGKFRLLLAVLRHGLFLMGATIHVIGAGLAGLASALAIDAKRFRIVLHEAAKQAGGRCRSYHDAALGLRIDNGNHLVLSGNRAVTDYLTEIGGLDRLEGPREASFDFADLATGARWTLRPNAGPIPWWIFVKGRRVPGTGWRDYLGLAALLKAGPKARIGDVMACEGVLYDRLWHPFLVAALNTEPRDASAALAGAVIRETLAKGGSACRPLVATQGLGEAFIDPALATLDRRGILVRFDHRLRKLEFDQSRVAALDFGEDVVPLAPGDGVILAVPAGVATLLVPGLAAPTAFRSIVNAHFLAEAPAGHPALLGLVNGTAEWLFRFPGRLSVTISAADRLLETPREDLAATLWREVASVTGLPMDTIPPHRIIKEKRATFAALPEEDAKRPGAQTAWRNLVLAGDWTRTGLPATIEGCLTFGHAGRQARDGLTAIGFSSLVTGPIGAKLARGLCPLDPHQRLSLWNLSRVSNRLALLRVERA